MSNRSRIQAVTEQIEANNVQIAAAQAEKVKLEADKAAATAGTGDVLSGKKAVLFMGLTAGTMPDKAGAEIVAAGSLEEGRVYLTVPETGRYTSTSKLYITQADVAAMAGLTAGKLLAGNMVLGITGTGQGGGIALSSIIVTTPPTKTQYAQAESFNPTGMVVTAIYSNGATRIVTDYTVSPTFFSGGERAVTISYTENGVITTVQQAVVVHTPTNDELYRAAITQVLVDEKIRLDDVTDSLNLFMEICTSFVDTDEDGTTYHLLHPDAAAVLVSWRLGYDGLEDIITDETRYIETILESFQESDLSALEFHSGWDGSLTGRYGLTAIGLAQSAIQSNIESRFGNPYIKNAIQMGNPVMTGSNNHADFRSDQVSKQLHSSNFLYFSPADN